MIDIRTEKPPHQRDNSWVRKCGTHEESGWSIALGRDSANIREPDLEWSWIVDRADVPAAFAATIDAGQLKLELRTAIASRMTVRALDELFREMRSQLQSAFWSGERSVQDNICKALGL